MGSQADAAQPARGAGKVDKIGWMDMVRLFERQWRWAAVTFVIVAVSATGLLSLIKRQWEAQATVRIGQVYDVLVGAGQPVEPFQEVLDRLRAGSFIEAALKDADLTSDVSSRELLLRSLKLDPVASTGLFRITVRGNSSEQATLYLQAIIDHLSVIHGNLAHLTRSATERLEAEYTKELDDLREGHSNLERALSSTAASGATDATAIALIEWALNENFGKKRDVEQKKLLLIRQDKTQSYPTSIVGNIPSAATAFPSRGLVLIFGIVLGLGSGVLVAMLRDFFSRQRPGFVEQEF